jgi:hypothetical protein
MRTRALRIILLAAVTAQIVMGAALFLRNNPSDTCGPCDLRVLCTAVREGFLPYCLDGEPPLMVRSICIALSCKFPLQSLHLI